MASGVAEIPTTSGFGPGRHWLQKLRLLARFRSLDSLKALPWRGSPKLSPPHQKRALLYRLTNRVHPNPNLTASLLISRSSSFYCGTALLTLS